MNEDRRDSQEQPGRRDEQLLRLAIEQMTEPLIAAGQPQRDQALTGAVRSCVCGRRTERMGHRVTATVLNVTR